MATLCAKLLCLRLSSSDLTISESAWDQSVSPSPVGGKGEENKPVRIFVQGHMSHSQEWGRTPHYTALSGTGFLLLGHNSAICFGFFFACLLCLVCFVFVLGLRFFHLFNRIWKMKDVEANGRVIRMYLSLILLVFFTFMKLCNLNLFSCFICVLAKLILNSLNSLLWVTNGRVQSFSACS